jgi:hypothetical protein
VAGNDEREADIHWNTVPSCEILKPTRRGALTDPAGTLATRHQESVRPAAMWAKEIGPASRPASTPAPSINDPGQRFGCPMDDSAESQQG